MPETLFPREMNQIDAGHLGIRWNDGHESIYDVKALRLGCHCAACKDEWSGESRVSVESIPDDIHPIQISPVGHYDITIQWSDGHDTGIYSFDYLRELCPCSNCRSKASKEKSF